MAARKTPKSDQAMLADALFPTSVDEDTEEAILSIPPEKRILRTEQYDFSVATLVAMMEKEEVLIPDFQRRYVWSERQASRLIESLIIQCPIPVIYLNQERNEIFSVIDGNQRLNTLRNYLADKFALTGLTSYPELTGLKYSELDKRFQRHINNRVLRCTVILKETHPQVKFDVFERLNSGAVALTRQELRHGLYFGPLLKAAASIAQTLNLERHFGGRKDKRMKAEELVIRYWALSSNLKAYEKPLATFLSQYAERNRSATPQEIEVLVESITTAHERASELFGAHCFNFSKNKSVRFNAAVFDAQMVACARLTESAFKRIRPKKSQLQSAYLKLQREAEFERSVTLATSDEAALQGRVSKVSALLRVFQ
jgi:hypothetical protein